MSFSRGCTPTCLLVLRPIGNLFVFAFWLQVCECATAESAISDFALNCRNWESGFRSGTNFPTSWTSSIATKPRTHAAEVHSRPLKQFPAVSSAPRLRPPLHFLHHQLRQLQDKSDCAETARQRWGHRRRESPADHLCRLFTSRAALTPYQGGNSETSACSTSARRAFAHYAPSFYWRWWLTIVASRKAATSTWQAWDVCSLSPRIGTITSWRLRGRGATTSNSFLHRLLYGWPSVPPSLFPPRL